MLANVMEICKTHELMPGLIKRMFDFELEVEVLEREIFSIPERMPLTFNYMDLFFQLYPATSDETFKKAARLVKELCRYYDKKSCLNLKHSGMIIDVFRYCIRGHPDLSKYLDESPESLDGLRAVPKGPKMSSKKTRRRVSDVRL